MPSDLPLNDVTEADVDGAIFCPVLATSITDLKVDFDFPGRGTFTGTVTNFDAKENFGGVILHEVTFDDGDKEEYSYNKIMLAHERFVQTRCPFGEPKKPICLRPGASNHVSPPQPNALPVLGFLPQREVTSLALPSSYLS